MRPRRARSKIHIVARLARTGPIVAVPLQLRLPTRDSHADCGGVKIEHRMGLARPRGLPA
eukprot:584480-Pleurochrysis_carterae.AAC.1